MAIQSIPQPVTTTLLFPGRLRRAVERFGAFGYPHEVCGLLLGRFDGEETVVEEVTEAKNLNRQRARDRYALDPEDFLRAEKRATERGLDVVGVWHTHPDHAAVPSQTDLDAAWPGYSYVIVSVSRGRGLETRSWTLDGDHFVEEEVLS